MENEKNVRLVMRVLGLVQGVGFRWFVRTSARNIGLRGLVCNLSDGSVEVIAEGPRGLLEELIRLVRVGPPSAHVRNVMIDWEAAKGDMDSFQIG